MGKSAHLPLRSAQSEYCIDSVLIQGTRQTNNWQKSLRHLPERTNMVDNDYSLRSVILSCSNKRNDLILSRWKYDFLPDWAIGFHIRTPSQITRKGGAGRPWLPVTSTDRNLRRDSPRLGRLVRSFYRKDLDCKIISDNGSLDLRA